MNADLQRILDKATELFDMMAAVENKWAAQGKATAVYVMFNTRATMEADLNGAANDLAKEFPATAGGPVEPGRSYIVGDDGQEIFTPHKIGIVIPTPKDEQSSDKPEAPKRGKKG
jgi:hypothetical protein